MRIDEIAPSPTPAADRAAHRPVAEPHWGTGKIQFRHLDRLAIVYVRQSTAGPRKADSASNASWPRSAWITSASSWASR